MDKKKKNLLIGGLLAVVLLLAVGYAAFATTLTINGTSSIDSRWDVHIKDNGVSVKSSNMATSTRAQKDSQLTASFACELTDPGVSTISYDIIVENTGTFGAKLSSINLTGTTAYIDATTEGIEVGDVIAGNGGTDTLTVTVSYKNVTEVPTGEDATANITVTLNYIQDDGSAVVTTNGGDFPEFDSTTGTGAVYSWNTNAITIGSHSLASLQSNVTSQPYYTSAADVMNASGYTFYNVYIVDGNTITGGYTCQTFGVLDEAVCLHGGGYDAGTGVSSYYNYENSPGSWATLTSLEIEPTFVGAGGTCTIDSSNSNCEVGYVRLTANSYGAVSAAGGEYTSSCSIGYNGYSTCLDGTPS